MGMFRISFLVDDKHLPGVLRDVAGKAHNLEVLPVVNLAPSQGKKLSAASDGDVLSMVIVELRKLNSNSYHTEDVRQALLTLKRPSERNNASGTVVRMVKKGLASRIARGRFMLNNQEPK